MHVQACWTCGGLIRRAVGGWAQVGPTEAEMQLNGQLNNATLTFK